MNSLKTKDKQLTERLLKLKKERVRRGTFDLRVCQIRELSASGTDHAEVRRPSLPRIFPRHPCLKTTGCGQNSLSSSSSVTPPSAPIFSMRMRLRRFFTESFSRCMTCDISNWESCIFTMQQ